MGIQQHLRVQRRHHGILHFKFRHTAVKRLHPAVIHRAQQFFLPGGVGAQPSTIENFKITPARSLHQNDALKVLKAADRLQFGQGWMIGPSSPQPENSPSHRNRHRPQTPCSARWRPRASAAAAATSNARWSVPRRFPQSGSAGCTGNAEADWAKQHNRCCTSPEIIRNLLLITNNKSLLF